MRDKKTCRACQSAELEAVFSLGEQSLSAFLLPGENPRYGPLDIVLCRQCHLVQLAHVYPGDWFYSWYGYRSGTNPMMVRALGELAQAIEERAPLRSGDAVLDIGSNDGTFLRQYQTPGLRLVGIDPVKNLGPEAAAGFDLFVNGYFPSPLLTKHVEEHGLFKAVTANAMFYELEDPCGFLRDVWRLITHDGLLVIQMNYLPAMLEQNGYDNIVHEHQTYDSLMSLEPALVRSGFRVVDVEENAVNGGSFRVWCAPGERKVAGGEERIAAMRARERAMRLNDPETYRAFGQRLRQLREDLRSVIDQVAAAGRSIYVYGASTRGLVIMEYTGLDDRLIRGAAERNPDKWGRSYGATGIPCVSEEEARAKADYFLVLPHHFLREFVAREAAWLARGGRFIVPLPQVRVIGAGGSEVETGPGHRMAVGAR